MRTDGFIGVILLLAVVVSVGSCAPAETPIDDSTLIAGDSVVVIAASTFDLLDRGEVPPAPVIVRMPLDP